MLTIFIYILRDAGFWKWKKPSPQIYLLKFLEKIRKTKPRKWVEMSMGVLKKIHTNVKQWTAKVKLIHHWSWLNIGPDWTLGLIEPVWSTLKMIMAEGRTSGSSLRRTFLPHKKYHELHVRWWGSRGVKLTIHFHRGSRSKTGGENLHFPYELTAWCYVKFNRATRFLLLLLLLLLLSSLSSSSLRRIPVAL